MRTTHAPAEAIRFSVASCMECVSSKKSRIFRCLGEVARCNPLKFGVLTSVAPPAGNALGSDSQVTLKVLLQDLL